MDNIEELLNNAIEENNQTELEKIKAEIIKTKNASLAYQYARECEDETKQLQKIVTKSQDAHLIYLFARDVFDADIEKLEKAVIETQNIEALKNFANLENANRKKLLKKIKQIEER